MSDPVAPIDLVFLWHHHQPDYRAPRDGRALLPWVRLHATKDYLDMARHLERHPTLRATFNFVPSLLDQLDAASAGAPDALFDLLGMPVRTLSEEQRAEVAVRCSMAPRHAFERWPRYRAVAERAARTRREASGGGGLTDAELLALEVWFLLAWIDPLFFDAPQVQRALERPGEFTVEHRDGLLALHARLTREVIPAYRALAERGQVELSESPYYHPILPLLITLQAARRARPDLTLPLERFAAPEDAELQVRRALDRHERAFGSRPAGMWPSEGSVSPEAVELAARAGLRWLATDEGVLWRSLPTEERRRTALYKPWKLETPGGEMTLFFRDHELSDRIGFVYHRWEAKEAVADFLERLRRIAREYTGRTRPVVSVFLDGENCWEYYPEDGGPFLEALYEALEGAPDIRTRTPSEVMAEGGESGTLLELHSGSWIDGDFHIWIGHPEKNRAWELLARARRALEDGGFTREKRPDAWESLYAAEGSDWFWWYGDDHFTADKALFDRIFREHLQAVYERAGLPVPTRLKVPVARVRGRFGVSAQPLGFIQPTLDGRCTHFYEWYNAGRHRLGAGGSSMHREAGMVRELYYGFDAMHFYVRLDLTPRALPLPGTELTIDLVSPHPGRVTVGNLGAGEHAVLDAAGQPIAEARCVVDSIVELGLPFAGLGLKPGDAVELLLQLVRDGEPIENMPSDELLRFMVPDEAFESTMWSV